MDNEADTKVFIGGLLPTTTKESLVQHMSVYGELTDAKVVVDKQTGLSKGYGFVGSRWVSSHARSSTLLPSLQKRPLLKVL
jgi:hypothetical protein